MTLEVRALELDREIDLTEFTRFLRLHRVPHRVSLFNNRQVVWVESTAAVAPVRDVFERFLRGELPVVDERVGANAVNTRQILRVLATSPMTMTILLATFIGFPVTHELLTTGNPGEWVPFLTLTDFVPMGGDLRFADLAYTFETGQWWRLLTPMFLHFGWLHLVFNSLWLWEFGRRLEALCGPLVLFTLVIVSSASANLLQYYMYGADLFGGMSGVVFGLVGYAIVWDKRTPSQTTGLPPGIYIFLLLYLALGFTGAVDLLGLGSLANGAHFGGLLAGIAVALIVTQWHRLLAPSE